MTSTTIAPPAAKTTLHIHPLSPGADAGELRGLAHRHHPEKGWQWWDVLRGYWFRDYEMGTGLDRSSGDHELRYTDTQDDPEEGVR